MAVANPSKISYEEEVMFEGDSHLRIGTSSWSSKDWVGPFYPPKTPPQKFIEHYSSVYDTVEIDATFYRMPTKRNVDAWRSRTPEGFAFAVKTPRVITHDKVLLDTDDDMGTFIEIISGLGSRLGPVLLQFPYFNKRVFPSAEPFLKRLDNSLAGLPKSIRFAVEVRNRAWVTPHLLSLLQSHDVALAWVAHAWMPSAPEWAELLHEVKTDFAYIRWIGDRKAIEKLTTSWDKLVVDRSAALADWAEVVRSLREREIRVFGYFNNHFAGHGPGSVEMFRELYERR